MLLCEHERHKVDLAQCALAHNGVGPEAVVFLVIASVFQMSTIRVPYATSHLHEMLDRCSDTARLDATHIRGGDMAREVRVFGEALKALQGG